MNCEQCKEILVEYLEQLLVDSQKQQVEDHLKGCRKCQAELQQMMRLQDRLASNGKNVANSDIEDDVMNLIIREQKKRLHQATTKASESLKIRRTIMKSPKLKFAAAAVVIIAVLAGLPFIGSSGPALADVYEKIQQIHAYMFKSQMTITGSMAPGLPDSEMKMDIEVLTSNDGSMRMVMTTIDAKTGKVLSTNETYVIPQEKVMTTVIHDQKKYVKAEFKDDMLIRMKKQNNDPREMIKKMLETNYTNLGKAEIDGVEVVGFETIDPNLLGGMAEEVKLVLWIDVETWLPFRSDMTLKMNKDSEMNGEIYYYWDVPITADSFEPVIPEDYTRLTSEAMQMPSITEEGAIEGLKFFAEIFGRYPEKLNMMDLMQKAIGIRQSDDLTEAGKRLVEKMNEMPKGPDGQILQEEVTKRTMDVMLPTQSLAAFYMSLVGEKKEPRYYGDSVSPGDADAVLLEWKASDNEKRVIYGDLSAETIVIGEAADAPVIKEVAP